MSGTARGMDRRVDQWWLLFAVALFLLVPLDLLTTLLAVSKHGTVVEANPIMRWLLDRGLFAVTAANLLVVLLAISLFNAAITRIRRAPESSRRTFAFVVNVWVCVLLVAGFVVVINNVLVLV